MLEDLADEEVRNRLRAIWADPKSLDPTARAARVTRDIADLLAAVARRIEKRGFNAEATSGFIMRVLFTMFAEDSGLIPEGSFTTLLKNQRGRPEHLQRQLTALWTAMDAGDFSPAPGIPLRKFNGYLSKDRTAIPLDAEELDVLIEAGSHRWDEVEPAIFGTLLDLGILSSRIHCLWAAATGGRQGVGNDSLYNHPVCFGRFPFPVNVPETLKDRIRTEAEALDALRKRVLSKHEDLTLTKLYNVLEPLREGRTLDAKERDIHDCGLVTLIRQHHDSIDAQRLMAGRPT